MNGNVLVDQLLDEEDETQGKEGWETITINSQHVGIRTSAIEEKCQAFETLVIYCSTLGPLFAPYMVQSLELALPALKFVFHEGVREACAMYAVFFFSFQCVLSDNVGQVGPHATCLRKAEQHAHTSDDGRRIHPIGLLHCD